ncbi:MULTISPECIES: ParB/RepB/Spo0J family partition protein [unclassified Clostridium]|jgi:ParB family chromosome partitioning protein|uniref:ParB/RepB/Spo0J family partition protein n=1 Tax=Clostridium TaxID=1485 RepID=UPI001C8C3133|nr:MULTISPECIES: ParB/RepB/Spo0J family partition protein [unclassified Clostridium]MBX9138695.1 ParB/RepB/Spo0J family partition protein [Clostridium sp. K12(2020)]MBX9145517.1 ParB/RepB/Spo0J family partition protein [Clostridium sp. K13]MDU2290677.1 ParB/RepB/Spo0J family partition protein [Clostridium celatum]MDU4325426.1 ParB/RepB/Spo0J family partition protein [Clostridium celatum]
MSKKFGLGKGLNALIPEDTILSTLENKTEKNQEIKEKGSILIDINLIKSNEDQPRKSFDDEKIMELAESIKSNGIIQPLILRKDNNEYIIVAGERRWRAAKSIGIKEVPAIIMDLTEKQVLEISLIENIQREDLNSIEEAVAYKKLISDFNLTQEELSKRIGKSRVTITNTLRLLNLSADVQQYIIEGVISEGHGRALLGITDSKLQCELAQSVIDDKLSVRELEILIKKLKTSSSRTKTNSTKEANPYYKDVTYKLENYFGTKVNITNKNNKGKIEIEYYSEEDLQRILEIINL